MDTELDGTLPATRGDVGFKRRKAFEVESGGHCDGDRASAAFARSHSTSLERNVPLCSVPHRRVQVRTAIVRMFGACTFSDHQEYSLLRSECTRTSVKWPLVHARVRPPKVKPRHV